MSSVTRRGLVRSGLGAAIAGPTAALAAAESAAADGSSGDRHRPRNGDQALERLLRGNRRFVRGRARHGDQDSVRRAEVAQGQRPFAIVLGCADSRVPPEVIFDQGLGDLFVVRVAGNTARTGVVIGSIEYSVKKFGSVLIMVLAHSQCGAVEATVEALEDGAEFPGSIPDVAKPIIPAVKSVRRREPHVDRQRLITLSIRANARAAARDLRREPLLHHYIEKGKLKVVSATYHLHSGRVSVL
jgi:carbonic anhydrase